MEHPFLEFSTVLIATFELHDSSLFGTLVKVTSILISVCVEDVPSSLEALLVKHADVGVAVRVSHRTFRTHPLLEEAFVLRPTFGFLLAGILLLTVTFLEVLCVDIDSISVHLSLLPHALVNIATCELHQTFALVVVPAILVVSVELTQVFAFLRPQLSVSELVVLKLSHEFSSCRLDLENSVSVPLAFLEIATVCVSVSVLHQRVAVEEVVLKVSGILVPVLVGEHACSHLRVLELSVELLTIAECENACSVDLIVLELALVGVTSGFVLKFALAMLAIQTKLPLVPRSIENVVQHALSMLDPVLRFGFGFVFPVLYQHGSIEFKFFSLEIDCL